MKPRRYIVHREWTITISIEVDAVSEAEAIAAVEAMVPPCLPSCTCHGEWEIDADADIDDAWISSTLEIYEGEE